MNDHFLDNIEPIAFYDKTFTYYLIKFDISSYLIVTFDLNLSPKEKRSKLTLEFLTNLNSLLRDKKTFNIFK